MMTLITAALIAAAPAPPAPDVHAQHQQGTPAEHKGMDCCKECCKDMAAKKEGHGSDHSAHSSH